MGQYDENIRQTRALLVEALNDYEERKKIAAQSAPSVAEFLLGEAQARIDEYHAALQTFIDAND